MKTVISFGEILWDHYKDIKMPGGAPMNVALHLQGQGVKSCLISAVGNDEEGNELIKYLKKQKLDTNFIQVSTSLPTGKVTVELDDEHKASYKILKPVAWDEIQFPVNIEDVEADAIIFGSLACRSPVSYNSLLKLLERPGLKVFDMNIRPPYADSKIIEQLLNSTDILKVNEDELEYLSKKYEIEQPSIHLRLKALKQLFKLSSICVTLGERGAIILFDETLYAHPGYEVDVKDTVGAGDAFLAAFIAGLLQYQPIESILETACATGAFVASRQGANPVYTQKDIDRLTGKLKD